MAGRILEKFGVPRPDEETRKRALEDPGPSWSEWFYFEFLKVWVALGFFIVDTWIAASWVDPVRILPMVGSLVPAVYLEFLAYRYLWRRPDPHELNRREPFKRNWYTPTRVGRWTPEMFRIRAGLDPDPEGLGRPDPRDFL